MASPTRVTAPPSPSYSAPTRARRAELAALKGKGNARTPAERDRLLDLLVEELTARQS